MSRTPFKEFFSERVVELRIRTAECKYVRAWIVACYLQCIDAHRSGLAVTEATTKQAYLCLTREELVLRAVLDEFVVWQVVTSSVSYAGDARSSLSSTANCLCQLD